MAAPRFPDPSCGRQRKSINDRPATPNRKRSRLPLVQLSVKIRRSKKELSYVFAFWFVICMNHIAWSCRYTRSYEFDGTMIDDRAERT